jgi:hypothetical protein
MDARTHDLRRDRAEVYTTEFRPATGNVTAAAVIGMPSTGFFGGDAV